MSAQRGLQGGVHNTTPGDGSIATLAPQCKTHELPTTLAEGGTGDAFNEVKRSKS